MRVMAASLGVLLGTPLGSALAHANESSSTALSSFHDATSQSKQATSDQSAADGSNAPELRLGLLEAFIGFDHLWIDGHRVTNGASNGIPSMAYAGLQIAYAHRVGHDWGVVGVTRIGVLETAYGYWRGEWMSRWDLAVGPELRINKVHLALPIGYSWLHVNPGEYRLVRDSYQGGHGLVASAVVGTAWRWRHHGISVELAYSASCNWLTHTATPIGGATQAVRERYRIILHQPQLGVTYIYRF